MTKPAKNLGTILACAFLFLTGANVARADDLKLLSANVFTGILDPLVSSFEQASSHKVSIIYQTVGAVSASVQSGAVGDVAIATRPLLEQLLRSGKIEAGIADLARSGVGLAVKSGAKKPDIGSVEAFKAAMRNASSISYANPSRGGATGILVTEIFQKLGLTDEMKSKTRLPDPGKFAVEIVAAGGAEIALAQPMEVLAQPGVELVGLLPMELQDPPHFTFSAAVMKTTRAPAAAKALVEFLSAPSAAAVFKAKGM